MPNYRRLYQAGGSYFFTVVTAGRWPLFNNPSARTLLGSVLRETAILYPFRTDAIVLLPDHLHCLWTLPVGDEDFSRRWHQIKREFTVQWLRGGGSELSPTACKLRRGHGGVWQLRFWEHAIRDERDYEHHVDYIHFNPVKHGVATSPWDWPWSSFRRFVRRGNYDPYWGQQVPASLAGVDWE